MSQIEKHVIQTEQSMMIQHEEEEENVGHSHGRALRTGCITVLGWRQLAPTPAHAAVNVRLLHR